jgi:hypothetical protein
MIREVKTTDSSDISLLVTGVREILRGSVSSFDTIRVRGVVNSLKCPASMTLFNKKGSSKRISNHRKVGSQELSTDRTGLSSW